MEGSMKQTPLSAFVLLTIGIFLIFLAVFLIIVGTLFVLPTDVKGGALFLIGPFPLILTFDNVAPWIMVLLLVLLILVPLLLIVIWLKYGSVKQTNTEV
ncbi:MAG: hypothetical protein RMJ14_05380 [Nitrososphaerota archaeon]|nr:hypothetical protein [Aigarchaeota archaeon]MDW8077050.1 hypothetical protein [Nitrososphaerota archaeon]